jgi:hypothetical protein
MQRTPTSRRRRPLTRAGLATLTGVLVVSGLACGGDDDDGEDTGTDPTAAETTTTPSTTTAPLSPEEEAKAVYLEFVDVVYSLLTTDPNPDDPILESVATGAVLANTRDSLSTLDAENHLVMRGDRSTHTVLSASVRGSDSVVLRDCSVGNDTTVDQDDGRVVTGGGLSTRLLEVVVERHEGGWLVAEIATVERFDGEVACPT